MKKEHIVYGDLLSKSFCYEITKDIDYVFHCAAVLYGSKITVQEPIKLIVPNVIMNTLVLGASYENKVKKTILISSSTGYPESEQPVKESEYFDKDPFPIYFTTGWMKRNMEKLAECLANYVHSPMVSIVLRPANIYGPNDKFNIEHSHVLPAMITKIVNHQKSIRGWGDGTEIRDVLYVEDLIDAMLLAVDHIDTFEQINIGYGDTIDINGMINMICDIENFYPEIKYIPTEFKMIPKRFISIEKAKNILGWQPKNKY